SLFRHFLARVRRKSKCYTNKVGNAETGCNDVDAKVEQSIKYTILTMPYFLLQRMELESMLQFFKRKFEQHELFYIVKSLTYFNDAENDADPILFDKNIKWAMVKSLILEKVKNFVD
ncbi:MAG: hypothetical protein GXO89_10585, partial [Chlorobi bacterium]|nr:hypothetical protein [Chlorobiota bacterium]